jgi:hypothetical protein
MLRSEFERIVNELTKARAGQYQIRGCFSVGERSIGALFPLSEEWEKRNTAWPTS